MESQYESSSECGKMYQHLAREGECIRITRDTLSLKMLCQDIPTFLETCRIVLCKCNAVLHFFFIINSPTCSPSRLRDLLHLRAEGSFDHLELLLSHDAWTRSGARLYF